MNEVRVYSNDQGKRSIYGFEYELKEKELY